MASPIVSVPAVEESRPDSEAIENISQADLIFYRNVELQTGLIQNYRNSILNMAVIAANNINHSPRPAPQDAMKVLQHASANQKKASEESLQAAAKTAAGETATAHHNLVNVVHATNLLMQNCVATIQQLDILAQAALAQAASLILSAAGENPPPSS